MADLTALGFRRRQLRPRLSVLIDEYAHRLPDDYVEFLRRTNGGTFSKSLWCECLEAPDGADQGRVLVGDLLGLRDLTLHWREPSRPDFWSGQLYVFANAPGGDLFGFRPGRVGVYFWEHDNGKVFRIASSFEDFLARLTPFTEEEEEGLGEADGDDYEGSWFSPDLDGTV